MAVCKVFSSSVENMTNGKTLRNFDGNYKPENDELLRIENFQIGDDIKYAIRNPLGVAEYNKSKEYNECDLIGNGYPKIKAIFVGEFIQDENSEHYNIAFQKYRKEQNLTTVPIRLYCSSDTFELDERFGIGLTNLIDCYYTGEELQFSSFYYARQIFDLNSYYRVATDVEVGLFIKNPRLEFINAEAFAHSANTYIRRKIAMINDSKVLENYEATQIKNFANKVGIDIKVSKKRLVIPDNREEAYAIIAFLDEEAYRGPFTHNIMIANSKRVVKNIT